MARTFPEPLTQEQWYDKIRSWIPSWYFLEEDNQEAHIYALSFLFAEMDGEIAQHFKETFITEGTGTQLDEHGVERTIPRIAGELDAQYQIRLRNITNKSNCPDLKELIDQVLFAGQATFIEDYDATVFLDRELFYNRGSLLLDQIVNVFTILVEKQVHAPYSFFDREYFCGREDFLGDNNSSDYVFSLIQAIINEEKATGTLYRVVERLGS